MGLLPLGAQASVELNSHSYVHNPSGQVHVVFHLASYKKGLFFGSCGPSTRSLQWEYSLELKGEGPDYTTREIELRDSNCQVIQVDSGSIRLDHKKHRATIYILVKQNDQVREFVGNGVFKIKPER